MTAKMTPALQITDEKLVSCTIDENEFPAYDNTANYAASTDETPVKVIADHVIYESLQADNQGNDPTDEENQGVWWTKLTSSNRWAPFDSYIQNQASAEEAATWVIEPGANVTAIALFNLNAFSVTIEVSDPIDGVVYDETFSLVDNTGVVDAYSYFFSPIVTLSEFCVSGLPPYASAQITITVSSPGGTAKVGQIAMGYAEVIGETLDEMPLTVNDYTRLNETFDGRTFPTIRGYARKSAPAITVDSFRVPYLERRIMQQRGVPTIWSFDTIDGEDRLLYFGYFENISFIYVNHKKSTLDLDLRSLV